MQKAIKKQPRAPENLSLRVEARELVHLPRHGRDSAISYVYEPTHQDEKNLGNLYIVGHIENVRASERSLLNTLALEARRAFYHSHKSNAEDRFRDALRQVNAYLSEHCDSEDASPSTTYAERFHVSIMSIAFDVVLLAEIGSTFSYILRNDSLTPISKRPAPNELAPRALAPFSHFVRGFLQPEDCILAVTPHFFDTVLVRELDDTLLAPPFLKELTQHGKSHVSSQDTTENFAAAALVLRVTDFASHLGGAQAHATPLLQRPSRSLLPKPSEGILEYLTQDTETSRVNREKMGEAEMPLNIPRHTLPMRQFAHYGKRLVRWYFIVPIAVGITLEILLSQILDLHQETRERLTFNAILAGTHTRLKETTHTPYATQRKRAVLAQAISAIEDLSQSSALTQDTEQAETLITNAMRQLDREIPPALDVVADFSTVSVEFSPQLVFEEDGGFVVAGENLSQLFRVSGADHKTRLVITGLDGQHGKTLALGKTLETPGRLIYLTSHTLRFYTPQTKALREQRVSLPKGFPLGKMHIASGMREFFVVSQEGPVARRMIDAKEKTTFSLLALPKPLKTLKWRGAAVISPSLFLLSQDTRLIQLTGGKLVRDTPLILAEPLDNTAFLGTLPDAGILALLDGAHHRIILITSAGEVLRQYRHEFFSELKDVIITENSDMVVLTKDRLLSFPYTGKVSP